MSPPEKCAFAGFVINGQEAVCQSTGGWTTFALVEDESPVRVWVCAAHYPLMGVSADPEFCPACGDIHMHYKQRVTICRCGCCGLEEMDFPCACRCHGPLRRGQ